MVDTCLLPLFHATAYALMAPGVVGLLRWFKARLQGRRGPDPWQPYRDLFKLLRKAPNVPAPASVVFRLAPPVVFTSYLLLGIFLPVFSLPVKGGIDLLFVIYLLGLGKFVGGLAAFDVEAPFGPMSSGRQFFVHILAEPALLVTTYALALARHSTDLDRLVTPAGGTLSAALPAGGPLPALVLVLGALAVVALAESGRLPFDNPGTHLELTMIEQGSSLEYSGRSLALLEWAESMKLTFFVLLLAELAFPARLAPPVTPVDLGIVLGAYPLKVGALLLLLALWELARAKSRLRAVVYPLMMALGLALVAVVYTVAIGYLFNARGS